MRVSLLISIVLLSIGAVVCAGAPGEGSCVLGVKRRREKTNSDDGGAGEPPAKKTLSNEQKVTVRAAEQRARMLARIGLESPQYAPLTTSVVSLELARELYQEFFEMLTRSIAESLVIASPPPDLGQEILVLLQDFIAKFKQLLKSEYHWCYEPIFYAVPNSTEKIGPLIDRLEEEFGWLRSQVFEDMSVDSKGKILDLLADIPLQFRMNMAELSVLGMGSCIEMIGELEGELDRLENWQALAISKLIPAILTPLIGSLLLKKSANAQAMKASYLLVIKYLKGELSVDLREMTGNSLKVLVEKYDWRVTFKHPETQHHFEDFYESTLSIPEALDMVREHFEADLVRVFDHSLKRLRFQAEVVGLACHTPGFPKKIELRAYNLANLMYFLTFIKNVEIKANADNDPRVFQELQHYRDLVVQNLSRFFRAFREYSHIPGPSEQEILQIVKISIPDFVPPGPRVPTKGAHTAAAEKAVPEGTLADPTAKAQIHPDA